MSILSTLRDLGGCTGGVAIYNAAKLAAKTANIAREPRKLKDATIARLQPVFPHLNLQRVRIHINSELPGNWYARPNWVEAMTFGYNIYFKSSGYQTDPNKLHYLVHELAHIEQIRRRDNSETQFACDYGEGYVNANLSYENNPLEIQAREYESAFWRSMEWPDGTWLRERNGAIWVIYGGAKFGVPDLATFDEFHPPAFGLEAAPDGLMAGIGDLPADGTVLREKNGSIWIVFGGAKFGIPDLATYDRVIDGKFALHNVWNGALAKIGDIPTDGTLLRDASGSIWIIFGGAKFAVPNPDTYDRIIGTQYALHQLWDGALAKIGNVPVQTTLLREENGAIWVVYGGAKFHVPDPATFDALFSRMTLHQLWDNALVNIGDIPRDNTLLREKSSTLAYRIVEGKKHPVAGPPSRWAHVLWNGALDRFPNG